MTNIRIVIPCQKEASTCFLTSHTDTNEGIEKLKKEEIAEVKIDVFANNTLTLTQLYNKAIDESKDSVDFLVLMHSDVYFELYDFVKRLIENKDKYDVVGFAGTKKISLSNSPLTWFTGSSKFPDERYGKVIQNMNGHYEQSFFNFAHPEVKDTEVLTIDGLLMCLNKKVLESGIRFDEQFTYDFYDLDFCFSIQTQTDFKIGVFVDNKLLHESVGRSVLTKEFLEPERKFRMKWQNLLVQEPKN